MEGTLAIGKAWILHRGNEAGQWSGRTLDEAFGHETGRLKAFIKDSPAPEVFSAHLEILEDPLLLDTIQSKIDEGMTPSEAVKAAADEISGMFGEIDDEYFKARVDDLKDVCGSLVQYLEGASSNPFENLPQDAVVVARELFPSDMAKMDLGKVRALVTSKGSPTSHVGIIARSRLIPFVTGIDISGIRTGDILLVDAGNSEVKVNPTDTQIEAFKSRLAEGNDIPEKMRRIIRKYGVKIFGNAGSVKDIEEAVRSGAEGIGLFRTEFLFPADGGLPSEEEQYQVYKKAVEACQGRPLTIRTMDIGGDKPVSCLNMPKEDNPFLGMRGIRLSLSMPDIFKEQIRAILRASAHGKVRMMIPMVTRVEELKRTKALVEECEASLRFSGIPFDNDMETGVMIETPAAAIVSDLLAKESDFFSVGTNDLTQYVMAADRGNSSVSYLCDPLDESVKRAVKIVVEAAKKEGIPVGVCGEAASDPEAAEVLCGLGIDSLSLGSPAMINALKQLQS
ncbi:MAG: phosphoenolpyruvate--protein phosphotransferase [Bacteroidales bacterium]|nr:phosphoenolpyruvate--protein phosphotransferase [Bacteroidales bacterium]